MGILTGLFEKRGLSLTDAQQWRDAGLLRRSAAGVSVNGDGALRYSAVYACVRVIAETVASLPLKIYERTPDGKRPTPSHYLYGLLHDQPNPYMTSFELRETLQGHLLIWGNAYCELDIDARGRVKALWPLRPDRMEKIKNEGDGLVYYYRAPDHTLIPLQEWQIFHLRGLSGDGILGYSPIGLMRQAIGLGLAAEEFGAGFFGNGANLSGVLQHPGVLGEEAHDRLRQSWQDVYQGLSNSHRVAILEEGLQYQRIGIPPEDAQFLETRKFQTNEIARIYRVPPHMIGDLERATFSNVEQQSIDFVVHTIRPWLVRWEQAIKMRLMSQAERAKYFAEFLVDGLLRGDITSRYQAYAVGRQNGWLSADEIREMENMNRLPGKQGDNYLIPLNMIPVGAVGDARADDTPTEKRAEEEKEQRQRRAAGDRQRLQNAQIPVYRDVAARILRREINDVGAQAKKMIAQRGIGDFRQWLTDFYEKHQDFVADNMRPVLEGYSQLIVAEAEKEVSGAQAEKEPVERFVTSYLGSYAVRHVARSQAAIESKIDQAIEEEADPLVALDELWEDWRDVRPGTIALEESVRANNAFAKFVYVLAGVTVLRWITLGDSCPYCQELDGRVTNITSTFVAAGGELGANAPGGPLVVTRDIGHPPAHRGCDCMVVAG